MNLAFRGRGNRETSAKTIWQILKRGQFGEAGNTTLHFLIESVSSSSLSATLLFLFPFSSLSLLQKEETMHRGIASRPLRNYVECSRVGGLNCFCSS